MISILLSINFQAAAKPSERPLRPAHQRSLSKFSFELSNVHDEMEEVLSLGVVVVVGGGVVVDVVVGVVAAVDAVYPVHKGIKLRWPGQDRDIVSPLLPTTYILSNVLPIFPGFCPKPTMGG